jgi:hypothetical protein
MDERKRWPIFKKLIKHHKKYIFAAKSSTNLRVVKEEIEFFRTTA